MSKKLVLPKDIQQARWEEKWPLLKEIFDGWASKYGGLTGELEILKCLIYGETNLELYLSQSTNNDGTGKDPILLNSAIAELSKGLQLYESLHKDNHGVTSMELNLLLAKSHFLRNDLEKSVNLLDKSLVTQDSVEDLSKRGRLLAAEAFCNKGKALEIIESESAQTDNIIASYQFSAEICLWIFTEENRINSLRKSTELVSSKVLPEHLFQSFIKPVEIEFQRGNIHEAVGHLRSFLRVIESKATAPLRKVLSLQLAEILLLGFCGRNYNGPPIQLWQNEARPKSGAMYVNTYQQRSLSTSSASGRSTPKVSQKDYGRSRSSSKDGSFCPTDEFEEALLALLLGESLVIRDGCVSVFEKDKDLREQTIKEANTVYDLLCIVTSRRKQCTFFLECLERGMKLAYHQFSLWFQYGLALICDKRYKKALMVLKKCHEMQPENSQVLLYCLKICINNLHQYDEAIALAQTAVEVNSDPMTKSSMFLATGISYSLLASKAPSHTEGQALRKKSIEALEKARDLDPNDVDAMCQLALNHAISRELSAAASLVNQALQLDPLHRDALLLLSLILSAQSRHQEALEVLDVVLREFPEDFHLLQVKVSLTEECFGGEEALGICQEMLLLWNDLYGEEMIDESVTQRDLETKSAKSSILKKSTLDTRSVDGASMNRSAKSLSFADGAKQLREDDEVSSITASVTLERSLSEIASTTVSGAKLRGPAAVAILAKIWLVTADVYLNMGNTDEASNCIMEASSIFPVSPEVLCMRGRLSYVQKNTEEAKACFNSALAVTPKYVEAMEKLAILHQEVGSISLAQKYIRDAIAVDPSKPSLWHVLGKVMAERDENEEASECFLTSLDLEATHPIMPFTMVPRWFKSEDL